MEDKLPDIIKAAFKITAVNFADWMIANECSAPITVGNVPLWIGNKIDNKTSEELYEMFLTENNLKNQ